VYVPYNPFFAGVSPIGIFEPGLHRLRANTTCLITGTEKYIKNRLLIYYSAIYTIVVYLKRPFDDYLLNTIITLKEKNDV